MYIPLCNGLCIGTHAVTVVKSGAQTIGNGFKGLLGEATDTPIDPNADSSLCTICNVLFWVFVIGIPLVILATCVLCCYCYFRKPKVPGAASKHSSQDSDEELGEESSDDDSEEETDDSDEDKED
jgi:hypothetical protein